MGDRFKFSDIPSFTARVPATVEEWHWKAREQIAHLQGVVEVLVEQGERQAAKIKRLKRRVKKIEARTATRRRR